MNPVFLDTSGLVALANEDDQWHAQAESAWRQLIVQRIPLVTTSLVLIELGDGLAKVHYRQLAVDLHDRLTSAPQVEVVQTTPDDEAEGWKLFRQRRDKEWGMTDCISMVVMQRRGINEVFSADHDFLQAGFSILLPTIE